MKWKANKISAVISLILMLVITFFRENVLLAINAKIQGTRFNKAYFYLLDDYLSSLNNPTLHQLKWGVTIFVLLVISGLTFYFITKWFQSREHIKQIISVYGYIVGFFVLFGALMWLFNGGNEIYPFLRRMVGVLSSPIPCFVLFCLMLYKEKSTK